MKTSKLMQVMLLQLLTATVSFGQSRIATPLHVENFTAVFSDVEPEYAYSLVYPIRADIINAPEATNNKSFDRRYSMSLFGGRYKSVASSSIGYYDYHQGDDITPRVVYNGITYSESNTPDVFCMCDGLVDEIIDGTDEQVEQTSIGRSVVVKCDQNFAVPGWGNIYTVYRHLESVDGSLEEGQEINMDSRIGKMGASGVTSTVHLHLSIQRMVNGELKNVNPSRLYDPERAPHLLTYLTDAEITQLDYTATDVLFRVTLPFNQVNLKKIIVSLEGTDYVKEHDFEEVALTEESTTERDNHEYVPGLELFAYPFNRGQTAHHRWKWAKSTMPAEYPASPARGENSYYPVLAEGLSDSPAYIVDVKAKNLPVGFDINKVKIQVVDVFGHGVYAYGTSSIPKGSFSFNHVTISGNDAEEYLDPADPNREDNEMELDNGDLEMILRQFCGIRSDRGIKISQSRFA